MNKWLEILIGLVLVIAPIWFALTFSSWGQATISIIKGGLTIFL